MTSSNRSPTALWFALLTVGFGLAVVRLDGNPTAVFFGSCVLLLVYFGADLSRVEVAPWFSIRFENRDADDLGETDDQTDDG